MRKNNLRAQSGMVGRRRLRRRGALAGVFACAAALSSPTDAQNVADPAAFLLGVETFNTHCGFCHSGTPESLGYGPPLVGIIGRPSASYEVYPAYTPALRDAEIVWSEALLRDFLIDSQAVVPGTDMPQLDLPTAEIDALMVYLREISPAR